MRIKCLAHGAMGKWNSGQKLNFYFRGLVFTSHWLNLQHWTGFYIAVYGNFQELFFYIWGLFFAFRGQNRPEPLCNFFREVDLIQDLWIESLVCHPLSSIYFRQNFLLPPPPPSPSRNLLFTAKYTLITSKRLSEFHISLANSSLAILPNWKTLHRLSSINGLVKHWSWQEVHVHVRGSFQMRHFPPKESFYKSVSPPPSLSK